MAAKKNLRRDGGNNSNGGVPGGERSGGADGGNGGNNSNGRVSGDGGNANAPGGDGGNLGNNANATGGGNAASNGGAASSGGAPAGGAPALTKSGQYAAALGRWAPYLWKEPNGLMCGSLLFALTCLPIVTAGPAWLALCHYMDARERGVRVPWWRGACARAFREAGARAWLMGFTDMLALAMAGGCALVLLDGGMPAAALLAYAIMLVCDLLYLLSGIYRYPALAAEPGNRLRLLAARGFLMALANIGWTLMFAFAQLLALMLCALTGVGLLLLFPAASALLSARAYASMAKLYRIEAGRN